MNYNPLAVNKYRLRNIRRTGLEELKPFSTGGIERLGAIAASSGMEIVSEKII